MRFVTGQPGVIFCGRQSIDYDGWQMASLLGEMLQLPSVSVAYKLEIDEGGNVTIERDMEGGIEIVCTKLPAVISAQKGLNIPATRIAGDHGGEKETDRGNHSGGLSKPGRGDTDDETPVETGGTVFGYSADDVPELVRLLHEESKVL